MKNINEQEQLFKTVELNKIDEVKKLIEAGADINAVDKNGITALQRASSWGRSDVVKMLIEAGADVNVVGVNGRTALYWASYWGYSEIVKILKEAGAK
jgi:ankyrin repeat protein